MSLSAFSASSTPSSFSPLLAFLVQVRSSVLRLAGSSSSPQQPHSFTVVLGNPSCDLDSFISAVLLSYFLHSRAAVAAGRPRRGLKEKNSSNDGEGQMNMMYVPLLNLPTTPSSELWRLRPEFGSALRLAVNRCGVGEHGLEKNGGDEGGSVHRTESDKKLLENLITIADVRASRSSALHSLFSKPSSSTSLSPTSSLSNMEKKSDKVDLVLVDHNAVAIPGIDLDLFSSQTRITGCIDHHIDEGSVPITAFPRIIVTGIGSCASLVVQHLRNEKLWLPPTTSQGHDHSDNGEEKSDDSELAKLALAPIFIDTANLTAEGKVSDTDIDAVAFLESCITRPSGTSPTPPSSPSSDDVNHHHPSPPRPRGWDRNSFYEEISRIKSASLELLTLHEILERDYKEWTEKTASTTTTTPNSGARSSSSNNEPMTMDIHIGIATVVQPLEWLLRKVSSEKPSSSKDSLSPLPSLLAEVSHFARSQNKNLAVFAIMTAFTSTSSADGSGGFQRELMLVAYGKEGVRALQRFQNHRSSGIDELRLEPWQADGEELAKLTVAGTEDEEEDEEERGEKNGSAGSVEGKGTAAAVRIWRQCNLAMSRKQVAPLLRDAVRKSSERVGFGVNRKGEAR